MSQRFKILPIHPADRVLPSKWSSFILPMPSADEEGCFNPMCEFLAMTDNVSHRDLPIYTWNTDNLTILFSTAVAAREAAYMLRNDWDGVNSVSILHPDGEAVLTTLDLLQLEPGQFDFCQSGKLCNFPEEVPTDSSVLSSKSDMQRKKEEIFVQLIFAGYPNPLGRSYSNFLKRRRGYLSSVC